MRENISVRQWQEQFRAGMFDSRDTAVQCMAGWYDWFCRDDALAGRLKKLSKVVMGITEPFILDNYYIWFKNNCPSSGPFYDDVRFEPLVGERNGKYFLVTLDCPYEMDKWALYTERYGFNAPEFGCANVRDMVKYVNGLGRELARGIQPPFIAEKAALAKYIAQRTGIGDIPIFRDGEHRYKYRIPRDRTLKGAAVAPSAEALPAEFSAEQAAQADGFRICVPDLQDAPPIQRQKGGQKKERGQER